MILPLYIWAITHMTHEYFIVKGHKYWINEAYQSKASMAPKVSYKKTNSQEKSKRVTQEDFEVYMYSCSSLQV